MIDLYFWPTPNGYKPLIMLEECQLEYNIRPVNIMAGDQFNPDFLKIAPNNRMPAIVDGSTSLFESGAILIYLAEKTGKFLPKGKAKHQTIQWLMWQMGGLGPMMGQANHFIKFASEEIPYGKKRYFEETKRLLGVLEKQLEGQEFIIGEYTIADIACYPWVLGAESLRINRQDYPNVYGWIDRISKREAVIKSYQVGKPVSESVTMDDKAKEVLYGKK